jgi:hypothetical protein
MGQRRIDEVRLRLRKSRGRYEDEGKTWKSLGGRRKGKGGIVLLVSWFLDRLRTLCWRKGQWKTVCVCVCEWIRARERGKERGRKGEGSVFFNSLLRCSFPTRSAPLSNSFLFYTCFILFYYFCPISIGGEHVKMTSAVFLSIRVATWRYQTRNVNLSPTRLTVDKYCPQIIDK